MKIKVSQATNTQLDWMVAKADGNLYPTGDVRLLDSKVFSIEPGDWERPDRWQQYSPATDWSQGGPIIEREEICICVCTWNSPWIGKWNATCNLDGSVDEYGPTPLIAAMRCFVTSKLGDEVEILEELT